MPTDTLEFSPELQAKLELLKAKLGADSLQSALNKSLNIANYVADTVHNPDTKLLVESGGKFTELTTIH